MALNMAIHTRNPASAVHHSAQGSQCTYVVFGNRCRETGVRLSMGTMGDAYDNAMTESLFASLECELVAHRSWKTKTKVRMAMFYYIKSWYNHLWLHSALNYFSLYHFKRKNTENSLNQETG